MLLSRAYRIHEESKFSLKSLKRLAIAPCFGDPYLIKNNSIFRNIRAQTLRNGYSFRPAEGTDYVLFPMAGLQKILRTKGIPFFSNARPLKEQLARGVNLELPPEMPILKTNHLFHESCHACLQEIIESSGIKKELRVQKASVLTRKRLLALYSFLGESAANTCETLAWMECDNDAHQLFMSYNNYVYRPEFLSRSYFRTARIPAIFVFVYFAFLSSHHFKSQLSQSRLQRISNLVLQITGDRLPSKGHKNFGELCRAWEFCQKMSPAFRWVTADIHFKVGGLDMEISRLIEFDFIDAFERISSLRTILSVFCATAIGQTRDGTL